MGSTHNRGVGKELCDLLVVFEDTIIIFSDKDCVFPNTGDLNIDWPRWFKHAVLKSAKQVWGAERWIRSFLWIKRARLLGGILDGDSSDL
jgi:hypothetical protein